MAKKSDYDIVQDTVVELDKQFDKVGGIVGIALSDHLRRAVNPLVESILNYVKGSETRIQLVSQQHFQEYFEGECLPQIKEIIDEQLGPVIKKYEGQSERLKVFAKEALPKLEQGIEGKIKTEIGNFSENLKKTIEKAVGDFIKKKLAKYTSETLEPRLKEVSEKAQGESKLEERLSALEEKNEKDLKAAYGEIEALKKSLEELRASYGESKVSEKTEEQEIEVGLGPGVKKPEEEKPVEKPKNEPGSLASMLADDDEEEKK